MGTFFNESEFAGLDVRQTQQLALEVLARFERRGAAYTHLLTRQMDVETFVAFHKAHWKWNNEWTHCRGKISNVINPQRQVRTQEVLPLLNEAESTFEAIEELYQGLIVDLGSVSTTFERLSDRISESFNERAFVVAGKLQQSISDELKQISLLKTEFQLGKNFIETVKAQKMDADASSNRFFLAFMAALLLLMIVLAVPTFMTGLLPDIWQRIALRVSLGIPTGFLSNFFFGQYRLQRILFLKYRHLENFLGGGISSIRDLLKDESELKADFHRRLMEMILDIGQELDAARNLKDPSIRSVKEALEVAREASETAKQIAGREK